jgi:hypothetical protein
MGQKFPLPERIPKPADGRQSEALRRMGITLFPQEKYYWCFTLPEHWRLVNHSPHDDTVLYYIVDEQRMRRVRIFGAWTEEAGPYDLKLEILPTDETSRMTQYRRVWCFYRGQSGEQERMDNYFAACVRVYNSLTEEERALFEPPYRFIATTEAQ